MCTPVYRSCKSCTFCKYTLACLEHPRPTSSRFEEWEPGHGGYSHGMEVEVREEAHPGSDSTALLVNNTPAYPVAEGPEVIVRAEEVLLVVLVLMIWVAAIALFFNRWGKIRMLEPYQPKFQQNHRPSCPLAPLSPPHITPQVSSIPLRPQNSISSQRMSFSKYNVNCFTDNLYPGIPSPNPPRRPRLNSVFVGSSSMAFMNPPRRVKSAIDIQHLIVNEKNKRPSISGFSSMLPIISMQKEKRPSITIERPSYHGRHRKSVAVDRPMLSHYYYPRGRRTSCFVDRRHKNFISFEQSERKASITIERSSHQHPTISFENYSRDTDSSSIERSNHQYPTISFESYSRETDSSLEQPTVVVEHAELAPVPKRVVSSSPKVTRSFEQPPRKPEKLVTPRLSTSLDVHVVSMDRRSSIPQEVTKDIPIVINFDETQISAPLLESLKSSDV